MLTKRDWKQAGDTEVNVALYARVSTVDQHPEAQLHRLREYAAARGAEAVEFVDHGVSGRKDKRPALDKLLGAARRREVRAVVVVKLDRLARSVRHLTQLAEEFEALDVHLVVLDQSIDTGTPAGRLLFSMLGAIAEFEADLVQERTRAGLAAARRRGVQLGRPPVVDDRMRTRIQRLRRCGRSYSEIASVTGISRTSVIRTSKMVAVGIRS